MGDRKYMAILEQTVCNDTGKISEALGMLCPFTDSARNINPYQFYAGTPDGSLIQESTPIRVQMVLPVGGPASGLYRFPRVGEKVLVEVGGEDNNYLLGYVPQNTPDGIPFTSSTPATEPDLNYMTNKHNGLILRYKNTAARTDNPSRGIADPKYSEIGFYQKVKLDKLNNIDNNSARYLDELQITSAGTTFQKTENEHVLHAKGIELLSGLLPGAKENKGDDLAVGDAKGETYALGGADIQIRAGGKVVIKAAESIVLQVGRSKIIIDDTGINLITKKINSNWVNTFDTFLSLNARNGISMFGQTVGISGDRSVNIGDSYGGAFDSTIGEVAVTGRDIELKALNKLDYLALVFLNGIDLAANLATAALAKNKSDPTYKANSDIVKFFYDLAKKTTNCVFKVLKHKKKIKIADETALALIRANEARPIRENESQQSYNDRMNDSINNYGRERYRAAADAAAPAIGEIHD
jgi:hypothetical protein